MSPVNLTFDKSGHRFIFRSDGSDAARMLEEIANMADDPFCPLDWLDAATLGCHFIGGGSPQSEY